MTVPYLVFSDVDETLIHVKSMFDFARFYFAERYGDIGVARVAELQRRLGQRAAAGESRHVLNRDYYRAWAGESVPEVSASARRWHDGAGAGLYQNDVLSALRRHTRDGAVLVLVSGSFLEILEPIAARAGATQVACTRPLSIGGVFTGDIDGEPMIGAAKGGAVRDFLGRYPHVDAGDCYAYGDDISDLPMLDEVGHPVAVGAGTELSTALMARLRQP